ncbi:MAG: alpha/beta hydrolase [Chloroflexi bacterium]|nr:alpha/beta hydrolase [Chloroflexota bacterium]
MDPIIAAKSRGYAVASINYLLSSEAIFPAPVADCREAIRFLRTNSRRWHIDPERLVAWGPSAGGYLASMIGAASHVPEFDGDHAPVSSSSTTVRAVIDWHGPIDFGGMDAQFDASTVSPRLGPKSDADSPESELLGAPRGSVPDAVR